MKRILVGLDGSPHERHVLQQAVALAKKLDGKLVLFRAVSLPIGMPPGAMAIPPADLETLLVTTAKEHLQRVAKELPAGIVEREQVELGVPWRAVCDVAREDKCDLVVVGSHGYGGIDRLIGTTAAKIVNHAHCSVLIARTPV
jgi:universal stress protein F